MSQPRAGTGPDSKSQPLDTEALVTRVLYDVRDLPMRVYDHTSQIRKRALDTRMLREAAERQGIRVDVLSQYLQLLRTRSKAVGFFQNMSSRLTLLDRAVTHDKLLTKQILAGHDIPVAGGGVASNMEEALTAFHKLGAPVVVKPIHGSGGRGVTVGVDTEEELRFAAEEAFSRVGRVLIEEMIFGVDLRVMTIAHQAVAVTLRVPANVLGDGVSTISELVELKNEARARNVYLRSSPIKLTPFTERFLEERGLNVESVPAAEERVFLHFKANISSGGDSYELIDRVHPGILRLAERASTCFPSAGHAGIDLLVPDLQTAPQNQACIVCEVNLNNELPLHIFPAFGTPVNTDVLAIEAYLGKDTSRHFDHEIDTRALKRYKAKGRSIKGSHSPDSLIAKVVRQPISFEQSEAATKSARQSDQYQLRNALYKLGATNITFTRRLLRIADGNMETVRHRTGSTVFTRELASNREALRELARLTGLSSLERVVVRPEDLNEARRIIETGDRWRIRTRSASRKNDLRFYVNSASQLARKWRDIPPGTSSIIMDRVATGSVCALLLLHGEVIATVLRKPPIILGDGERTLGSLIQEKVRVRSEHPYLQHMPIKEYLIRDKSLARKGFDRNHVPAPNAVIPLARSVSTALGVDTFGLPGEPYPRLRAAARRLVHAIGTPLLVGVDFALAAGTASDAKTPSWVLSDLNPDPVVSEFLFPWAGHQAAVFESWAQALMAETGINIPAA